MTGKLCVNEHTPSVEIHGEIYPLASCKLTKHTDGSWNFNMNLDGNYYAQKEGTRVQGFVTSGKFHALGLAE